MNNTAATIPTDSFRINDEGHLVEMVWPTYEDEVRVTFGPSEGVIRRVLWANTTPAQRGLFGSTSRSMFAARR